MLESRDRIQPKARQWSFFIKHTSTVATFTYFLMVFIEQILFIVKIRRFWALIWDIILGFISRTAHIRYLNRYLEHCIPVCTSTTTIFRQADNNRNRNNMAPSSARQQALSHEACPFTALVPSSQVHRCRRYLGSVILCGPGDLWLSCDPLIYQFTSSDWTRVVSTRDK